MKVQVAPFWVPDEGAVRHNGWLIAQGPDRVHLPSQLKPWDYQTDLHLSTKLLVDRAAILTQAHLGAASAFEILVMVRSNTTKVERNVLRLGLPDADTFELRCDFVLQG